MVQFNFGWKQMVLIFIVGVSLLVDTEHDWKQTINPYLHIAETTVLVLKLSVCAIALWRVYVQFLQKKQTGLCSSVSV